MFAFLDPVVVQLHDLLTLLDPVLPAALVIVLLTVLVRGALHPLNRAAFRSGLHRRRIAPQIKDLQQRHRHDQTRLRQELLELHTSEGVSPAAGCLPLLVQLPVIGMVYRLFTAPALAGHTNLLLHHTFLGAPLSAHLATAGAAHVGVFIVLLVLAVMVATLVARQTRRYLLADTPAAPMDGAPQATAASVQRLVPWMSFGTVLAVALLPLAAGLYLVTSAIWTATERALIRRTVTV